MDGKTVLDDIVFLVDGDEATLGSSTVPGQVPFTGTIRDLPVRTPLCDWVRSR
jgi:hypothetical protein